MPDADAEAGVCLALLVLADIICQSDQPIVRKFHFHSFFKQCENAL